MKKIKSIMVWLAPTIIIMIAISVLFLENYQDVSEPPDDNWSRGLKIGKTSFEQEPFVHQTEDGQRSLSYLTNDGVQQNIYNDNYELISDKAYDIPVDKFTSIFVNDDKLIYSDYYSMFNGETKEKIQDITDFFPLKEKLLYKKENALYLLHTDEMTSTQLFELQDNNASLIVDQSEQGVHVISQSNNTDGNLLTFYQLNENKIKEIGSTSFDVKSSEEVKDIQFTTHNCNYLLLMSTVQKQSSSGKMTNFYYFADTPIGETPDLKQISFKDPHGNRELRELSDIKMKIIDDKPTLLFKAFGSTKTTFKDALQFNIYKAEVSSESTPTVTRLSNTPNSSSNPVWLDDKTVVWIDHGGEENNRIYLASTDQTVIDRTSGITQSVFIQSLGKTIGMLSYSFLAAVITVIWFIWPLVFIVFITIANNRSLDQDQSWIFYTGVLIYLVAALIFKGTIFTDAVMANAPSYLSFTGSSFIYLIGFALASLVILRYGAKVRDWSTLVQLTYFIGIHVSFITVFFGPYLI
ncbi:hypothetical protein [Halobacillus mangrovi]|uniref:Uncharacterized protein n=1 Tax=Halobacillus mangrovi TaxID=402384 RepID=A0A1W5ZTR1_9BACI|nr:hypothetical protein [Halobacillus mangrovi]ARI76690.1 hypothetical protein HM131_07470 [Halobacillus mangrovi]